MATRGIEPITLPWKRPEKGVSAAELGASFRVEQREDGWHCTVRVGRRAEVLATGLRRLRDAQCRAEAHAATMPEVATALAAAKAEAAKPAAKAKAEASKPAAKAEAAKPAAKAEASKPAAKIGRKGPGRATQAQAAGPAPSPAEDVPPPTSRGALNFEQVSDGCICGKIEAGTWIADPTGKVSVPAGTDPDTAQEICRVAAKHYAAPRQKTAAPDRSVARSTSTRTAKRDVEPATKLKSGRGGKTAVPDAAPVAPPRRAARTKRNTKRARKRLAAKLATKPARRAAAPKAAEPASKRTAEATAKAAAKTTAKAAAKTTAKGSAKAAAKTTAKGSAKAAVRATAKTVATRTVRATPRAGAKSTARAAASVSAKTAGRRRKGTAVAAVAPPETKDKPMGKKTGKTVGRSDACGCVTWAEVEGKARGETKHGAFVIEPEGKKHALYFYDLEGQSRHLQSGEAGKLRKVAEEMAARGQPAMKPTSAGDDGALLKMFMAGAMEEET